MSKKLTLLALVLLLAVFAAAPVPTEAAPEPCCYQCEHSREVCIGLCETNDCVYQCDLEFVACNDHCWYDHGEYCDY